MGELGRRRGQGRARGDGDPQRGLRRTGLLESRAIQPNISSQRGKRRLRAGHVGCPRQRGAYELARRSDVLLTTSWTETRKKFGIGRR